MDLLALVIFVGQSHHEVMYEDQHQTECTSVKIICTTKNNKLCSCNKVNEDQHRFILVS